MRGTMPGSCRGCAAQPPFPLLRDLVDQRWNATSRLALPDTSSWSEVWAAPETIAMNIGAPTDTSPKERPRSSCWRHAPVVVPFTSFDCFRLLNLKSDTLVRCSSAANENRPQRVNGAGPTSWRESGVIQPRHVSTLMEPSCADQDPLPGANRRETFRRTAPHDRHRIATRIGPRLT